jgi:cytoskeletal protein CcmA (bactofilin family)
MAEVRIKDIDEHEIDTILAEDIDFEGHLTFKKPLMIKGKFKGEIKSSSALYIGEKAYVEAATEAGIVSSKGSHKGNIVGHSRVELFSTAEVEGDIATPDFVVESGCKFNGTCTMGPTQKKDAPPASVQHPVGVSAPAASPAPSQPRPAQGPQPSHVSPLPHGGQAVPPPANPQRPAGQQGGSQGNPGGQGSQGQGGQGGQAK